ncbi:hypothetical protein C7M84_021997 [Penaeus vannamei]|uniref:Uncharacterized protein n=1 Tax=Penaeus vannamei TaxID=6689 RepID=A0A423U825_PENVA|nr:hypothetical protein C7M84_021997 [Penaeus vannamei]
MTSPNVTASLCFLVCVLVSATSAIPASSSLLPLLPRIYFLRYSCSIVNFPLSLLLLPLSSLPPLRSFLCCIRYPCFLASAPSPPLPRLRCLLPSFLCHFRYPSSLQPASDLGHRRGLRYWPRRPSVRVSFSWGMSRCTDGGAEGSLGGFLLVLACVAVAAVRADSKPHAKPVPKPHPIPEAKPKPDPKPKPNAKPDPKPNPKPKVDPKAKADPDSRPQVGVLRPLTHRITVSPRPQLRGFGEVGIISPHADISNGIEEPTTQSPFREDIEKKGPFPHRLRPVPVVDGHPTGKSADAQNTGFEVPVGTGIFVNSGRPFDSAPAQPSFPDSTPTIFHRPNFPSQPGSPPVQNFPDRPINFPGSSPGSNFPDRPINFPGSTSPFFPDPSNPTNPARRRPILSSLIYDLLIPHSSRIHQPPIQFSLHPLLLLLIHPLLILPPISLHPPNPLSLPILHSPNPLFPSSPSSLIPFSPKPVNVEPIFPPPEHPELSLPFPFSASFRWNSLFPHAEPLSPAPPPGFPFPPPTTGFPLSPTPGPLFPDRLNRFSLDRV